MSRWTGIGISSQVSKGVAAPLPKRKPLGPCILRPRMMHGGSVLSATEQLGSLRKNPTCVCLLLERVKHLKHSTWHTT